MYESLTCFIDKIDTTHAGKWEIDDKHKGTSEDPLTFPWIRYDKSIPPFVEAIYQFVEDHEDLNLRNYDYILEKRGIKWDTKAMSDANADELDGVTVLALLVGIVRAERFCDGILLKFLSNGSISNWLKRLKELDETGGTKNDA